MADGVTRVSYFNSTIPDAPGEGYRLLSQLAEAGVNLVAFQAVPVGPSLTQLALFPEDEAKLQFVAQRAGMTLEGPHPALLYQGVDELGALASIHQRLAEANVSVFASSGIATRDGRYGCILYLRQEQIELAAQALEL